MQQYQQITAPAVAVAAWPDLAAYLRLDDTAEQSTAEFLLQAATQAVEAYTQRCLITRTMQLTLDSWHFGAGHTALATLRYTPVANIDSVALLDANGAFMPLASEKYQLLHGNRLLSAVGYSLPQPVVAHGGIRIVYQAGYGTVPENVPEVLRTAVLQLTALWFEGREPPEGSTLPVSIRQLLHPYRPRFL